MKHYNSVALTALAVIGAASLVVAGAPGVSSRHPIYVGIRTCSQCHAGSGSAHLSSKIRTFSQWRVSQHAQAYASLWSLEAKRIAQLSGIRQDPQEAAACLGCHATAYNTEEWEKGDDFFLEDGIQCETCHGPGSEYMDPEIMMDRQRAMENGMTMPDERACMMCHKIKGSHVAILGEYNFDVKKELKTICGGPDCVRQQPGSPPANKSNAVQLNPNRNDLDKRRYTGVIACAKCHEGKSKGYQLSRWRLSKHARAFAILGTASGRKMARDEGVEGNPQLAEQCLSCHATGAGLGPDRFTDHFDPADGVQCESCHGPGSAHLARPTAGNTHSAGLDPVTRETCLQCHDSAHGRPFDYQSALEEIAHPVQSAADAEYVLGPRYKTPINMAISPNSKELYVTCEASSTVIVVDLATAEVVAEISLGGQPTDVAFNPDGSLAYVTNRLDDTLAVIDTKSRVVLRTVPVGDEPHGVLLDSTGRFIYVLNTAAGSISVLDAQTLKESTRLAASRSPWSLAMTPDGKSIAVTNALSRLPGFREPPVSEITFISTERGMIENRVDVPGTNLLQGIAWHPSGRFALVTSNRTKNLIPITRLLQGWTITNGLAVIWRDGRVDQILLDEPHLYFPDPADVAISPDGRYAFVTSSGSNQVAVVDVDKMISMLQGATPYEREHVFPNHLGKPTEFIVKHIKTGDCPRGVMFSPDGKTALVANSLDDSITVIDVERLEVAGLIDLGGPEVITKIRFGEKVFHSADVTFRRQFSCHSCHPDGHVDGLTYDIEPDGIGISPVDNRTLRGILDTAPFKWEGTNPSLQRQCGPRLAVFFTRIDPFTPEELSALETFICTIPRPPNRYRAVGGDLTPAQRRGKSMFERTVTNDGREIPFLQRCATCHFPPLFTDRSRQNVGTKMEYDRTGDFDVPHLSNIYDSAPYLHNGISHTLEEIWTRYNPYDEHGFTNDMTKDQLNDLIEYLKTL